jgi:hypothetical protein
MKPDNEQYNKVIELLRKSKPSLDDTTGIEREVIRRVSSAHSPGSVLTNAFDFIFGWVYIGWIRRSLIAASFALVFIFIYQQSVILKRIDFLSRQTIKINHENQSPTYEFEKFLTEYRNSGRRFASKNITISEKQLRELFDSVNELQIKFKDLEKLIDEDPELRKLIEKKLDSRKRINL